jgi:hypothetical protein
LQEVLIGISGTQQKPPGFPDGLFVSQTSFCYSPPPNRRDHHPARRGWVSVVVSEPGRSAGAGAGDGDAAGSLWLTGAGGAAG